MHFVIALAGYSKGRSEMLTAPLIRSAASRRGPRHSQRLQCRSRERKRYHVASYNGYHCQSKGTLIHSSTLLKPYFDIA